MLTTFTSKMYVITYECPMRNYSRSYGIFQVFNKSILATNAWKRLVKDQTKEDSQFKDYIFKVEEVDLINTLPTELFRFNY